MALLNNELTPNLNQIILETKEPKEPLLIKEKIPFHPIIACEEFYKDREEDSPKSKGKYTFPIVLFDFNELDSNFENKYRNQLGDFQGRF
jgi:hypothetical protein